MSPPCFNCHGAPNTTPWPTEESLGECAEGSYDCLVRMGPEDRATDPQTLGRIREWIEAIPPFDSTLSGLSHLTLPTPYQTEAPACSAEAEWPAWLREAHRDLQANPWWVRGNFERTRGTPHPVGIDLNQASAELLVRTRPDATYPLVDGMVYLVSGEAGGTIRGHLRVENNEIPLLHESLLEFSGLSAEVRPVSSWSPSLLTVSLDQVTTGDFGGLHFLGTAPTGLMFFIQPFAYPTPPPGFDVPTPIQWRTIFSHPSFGELCWLPSFTVEHIGVCPQWLRYPDRRADTAPLDINLLRFLPERLACQIGPLLSAEGRLPQFLSVQQLLDFLLLPPEEACPPAGESRFNREAWSAFFESAEVELRIDDLADLFVPGRVDLGTSGLHARLFYSEAEGLQFSIPSIDIHFDAMGGGGTEATPRATTRLESGRISSGPLFDGTEGVPEWEPGIHGSVDPATGQIHLTANLDVEFELPIPGLGSTRLRAQLLSEVSLARTDAGLRPMPGSSTLMLRDVTLESLNGEASPETRFNAVLTDNPEHMDAIGEMFSVVETNPPAQLRIEGLWRGHPFLSDGRVTLRRDDTGLYAMPHLENLGTILRSIPIEAIELNASTYGGRNPITIRSEWVNETPVTDPSDPETIPSFHVDFAVERSVERRGVATVESVIPHGRVGFEYLEHTDGTPHDEYRFYADVSRLRTRGRTSVDLSAIHAEFNLDRLRIGEGIYEIRVPTFRISAEPTRHPGRSITGALEVVQSGGDGLEMSLNLETGMAELHGLDLGFHAQVLNIAGLVPESWRRSFPENFSGGGIDGHLMGEFQFHYTGDPRCTHGEGLISLRGDRSGDLYLVDARGERVGPPLIRDTRWEFRRIDWVNWARRYALGDFNLDLILNSSAIPGFSELGAGLATYSDSGLVARSAHGTVLAPYEIAAAMPYNNQPWSMTGFHNRIVDYLLNLHFVPNALWGRSSPRIPAYCREGAGGDR